MSESSFGKPNGVGGGEVSLVAVSLLIQDFDPGNLGAGLLVKAKP